MNDIQASHCAKQNILFNVWDVTSELSDSVVAKRIRMEQLVQKMKVRFILKAQVCSVEYGAN